MTYGLQTLTNNGNVGITVTDNIHRVVGNGVRVMASGDPSIGDMWIPFAGMEPTEEWFVVVAGDASAYPGTGGWTLRVYGSQQGDRYPYTVYRR